MTTEEICRKYYITNYSINPDGSIDVDGSVYLYNKGLTELPLNFNRVTGDFDCRLNRLTSLKGSPRWVGGDFNCNGNSLTNLEFSPEYVGGGFHCNRNDLTDNYCDIEIGGGFFTTLEQDGLIFDYSRATNYNEWRKMYKRKQILNDIFKIGI
jgi:hypothetical protein